MSKGMLADGRGAAYSQPIHGLSASRSQLDGSSIHLILDLYGCDVDLLDDVEQVKRTLLKAAEATGAPVLGHVFHRFSPVGVSGAAAMAASHITIHSWPEYGYAAGDIFSGRPESELQSAAQLIVDGLKCADPRITKAHRGGRDQDSESPAGR